VRRKVKGKRVQGFEGPRGRGEKISFRQISFLGPFHAAKQFYFFLLPSLEIFDCAADARRAASSYSKAMLETEF
jgi:hypothetical protein